MKKTTLITALIILFISGSIFVFLYKRNLSSKNTVKVVVSYPIGVSTAESSMNAVRLAFKEAGYKAGPYKIELIEFNDGDQNGAWIAQKEKTNAEYAAADPSVVAYIGPLNSGASKVLIPILNRAGIVHINSSNTWPGLTQPGFMPGEPGVFYPTGVRNYFRIVATDDLQGAAAAIWAQDLNYKNTYVLNDKGAYGKGISDLFTKKYNELGLHIAGQGTIDTSSTDFADLVVDIVKKKPDLVYYGGDIGGKGGIVSLIPELRKGGYKGGFMGPDALLGKDLITGIGAKDAEGIYITSVGIPAKNIDNARAKKFRQDYMTEYGKEPEVFGATAFEAANIILKAVEEGGSNRRAVLNAVAQLDDFNSMFGPISFDRNGDVKEKNISANVVRGGEFEFLKKLDLP